MRGIGTYVEADGGRDRGAIWIVGVDRKEPAASSEQLRWTWQNRQAGSEPVRLGAVVRALIRAEGLDRPGALASLQGIWEELVGVELGRHSRLEGLRRGTLRVEVDSAAHMAELRGLIQAGLAEQLSERCEDMGVRSIRLKLGSQNVFGAGRRQRPGRGERR